MLCSIHCCNTAFCHWGQQSFSAVSLIHGKRFRFRFVSTQQSQWRQLEKLTEEQANWSCILYCCQYLPLRSMKTLMIFSTSEGQSEASWNNETFEVFVPVIVSRFRNNLNLGSVCVGVLGWLLSLIWVCVIRFVLHCQAKLEAGIEFEV